ncbi:type IV toxin-antitoxin system AbiEi family antitoxin domain-containing protein [Desertihabitans brevis]|nr:type IV toxin-antitoxin system AbiEi family antitoxin domain-containing protein [Desertihabitans brevis]
MRTRIDPPPGLTDLVALQGGVASIEQVMGLGLPRRSLQRLVAQRRWVHLCRGIYGVEPLTWVSHAWAGTLLGGDRSRIGGTAALHLHGLVAEPPEQIDVWVPREQRPGDRGPWRFRRETPVTHSGATVGGPPRLAVEDAVLDAAADLAEDDWAALVITTVQCRRSTARRLARAARHRQRLRHRRVLDGLLGDVTDGVESPLERAYLHAVERAHGLPRGVRQHRSHGMRRDVVYRGLGVVVELDSRWHDGRIRFDDMWRDNVARLSDEITLRYGWPHVVGSPCRTAQQVAELLIARGWPGLPTRCDRCRRVP